MQNGGRHSVAILTLTAIAGIGCSRDVPAGRPSSARSADSARVEPSNATTAVAAPWDTAAGPFFAVAGDAPSRAYLVYPAYTSHQNLDTLHLDSNGIVNARLDLLMPGDSTSTGRVAEVLSDTTQGCSNWPMLRLIGTERQPIVRPWSVAFLSGRATTVPHDSLPARSRGDSVRLTIAIARAASKAPDDTAGAFRGRPYAVRQAYRFTLDDGTRVVLAEATRAVNQEANPLQEDVVLVLESSPGKPDDEIATAYSERKVGLEEALESLELISVLRLGSATWAILVRRDIGDGFVYALFERRQSQHWALRWRSAYAGC